MTEDLLIRLAMVSSLVTVALFGLAGWLADTRYGPAVGVVAILSFVLTVALTFGALVAERRFK